MLTRLICGLLVLVSSFFINADEQCLLGKKTMFIFSNGMFNGEGGINESTQAMEGLVKDLILYHDNNGTPLFDLDETYDFASAKNIFSLSQLYQVISQRSYTEKYEIRRWLNDRDSKPDWVGDEEEQGISELLTKAPGYNDAKLAKMINQYMAYLDAGMRVVIIAHSQGNLYANMAVARIIALKPEYINSIGVVSVASPDNHVVSGLVNYTTAEEDSIINFVRNFYPSTLPGNIALGDLSPGFANHAFVKNYLSILNSRNNIKQGIEYLTRTLQYPDATTQDGAITIRLDWNDLQDVDLHVYEPSTNSGYAEHVYYGNKEGIMGYLDVDNTYGYGPEHYNVQCNTLAPGSYTFGVDYYSSNIENQVANYTISVQAGPVRRVFSGTINNPENTSEYNPRIVGAINVTINDNGEAQYQVVGH